MSPGEGPEVGRPTIKVLVVDDERAFSELLAMAIDSQPDLACVGVATTARDALEQAVLAAPDVVLMDVRLPDLDGIEAAARLKQRAPTARVLVLTAYADPDLMARAASVGVAGFLPKESQVVEILRSVRLASDGGMLVDPGLLSSILATLRTRQAAPSAIARIGITERELDVLRLMGDGHDPQTIAQLLRISVHTCRGHVKSILRKLGAHSQLEAVVIAAREGLLAAL